MNASPFPRELYDIVVNHFHDDIPTLRNLALVDRASANICQSYIFHQITLRTQRTHNPSTATPCFKLHEILLSSAHLAIRVKHLTVDDRESCDHDIDKYSHVSFVVEDEFLPFVLDALPQITCLRLLLDSLTWSSFSPYLQSSVQKIFASDNLLNITMLALHDVPLSLFCANSRLHRLCLLDSTVDSDIESDVHDRCRLEILDLIVDDPTELLDQASPFDLTHLQRLSISLGLSLRNQLQSLTMLLEDNASTLEFLGLHIFEKPPSPQAINIGCLTSLRHLLIDIPTWLDTDMMLYLAHLLQNLAASSSIQTITVVIIVSEACTLHEWEGTAPWQALDSAFSGLTSASLIEVKIQVHSNEGRLEEITGLDLVEKGLPGLLSRGILKVEKIPDLPAPYIT